MRTGRHGPTGTVFSTLDDIPDGVANHAVLQRVMAYFGAAEDRPTQRHRDHEPSEGSYRAPD